MDTGGHPRLSQYSAARCMAQQTQLLSALLTTSQSKLDPRRGLSELVRPIVPLTDVVVFFSICLQSDVRFVVNYSLTFISYIMKNQLYSFKASACSVKFLFLYDTVLTTHISFSLIHTVHQQDPESRSPSVPCQSGF